MNTEEQKKEVSTKVKITPKYLMGTKAFHQLGEISSDVDDLFLANSETEKYWVGMWVTGLGFFDVLFPKATSRELTEEEIKEYNNTYFRINSNPPFKLNVG